MIERITPPGVPIPRGPYSPAVRAGDFRAHSPRFQPGNVERNLALVETLRALAAAQGLSMAQLAIAWVATQGADIVPLIGARRRDRLVEARGVLKLKLSSADLAALAAAVPPEEVAGERYPASQLVHMDSEKAHKG